MRSAQFVVAAFMAPALLAVMANAGCSSLHNLDCSTTNALVQVENGCFWGCGCSTTGSEQPVLKYTCDLSDDGTDGAAVPYFAWLNVSSTDKAAAAYDMSLGGDAVFTGVLSAGAGATTTNTTATIITPAVGTNLTATFTYDTTSAGAGAQGAMNGGVFRCVTSTGPSTEEYTPDGLRGSFTFIGDAHSYPYFTYNLYRRNTTHPQAVLINSDEYGGGVWDYHLPFACGWTVFDVEAVLNVPGAPALVCPQRASTVKFNMSTVPSMPKEVSVKKLDNTTLEVSFLTGYSGGCGPSTFTVTGVPPNPSQGMPVTVTETIPYQYPAGNTISIPIDMGKCYDTVVVAVSAENMHGYTGQIYAELKQSCPGDPTHNNGLTTGEKAGIGVAVVVVVVGAAGAVMWYRRRQTKAGYDEF